MEELDEFGIPIKKQTSKVPVDEFGIPVKKKGSSASNIPQQQQTGTTGLPVEDGLSATPVPTLEQKQAKLKEKALAKYKDDNTAPFTSTGGKLFAGTVALIGSPIKTIYQAADDAIVSARKALQQEGFFDDDIPDTDTPITDAMKKKASTIKTLDARYSKPQGDGGPLDPTPLIKGAAEIGLKIINSTMPQDQKNIIISSLNLGDAYLKRGIRQINKVKDYALPKDNLAVTVAENVLGIVPDIVAADLMGSTAAAEGKLTKAATEISEGARPLIQKYLPKAAKFIEEAVRAPFTKIMAAKGVASGIANAEEGGDIIEAGLEGGIEGAKEGVIMHGLGVAAGKVTPKMAKLISKTGLNSTWSTGIANPLANAGVFTTAKAIRTPIETGELATGEELIMEAGTGVGFSLLHAGSLAKSHNELNHYADNTLKTDATESLKRVVNETKDNLDLIYNPDLTPENISQLEEARNDLKTAIIREPDLQNKQLLINEALKIQNQLDAHSAVNDIIEHKDQLIEGINSDESASDKDKDFYTKKIKAIANHFDNSESAVKRKELNVKIADVQKKYDISESEEDRTELENLNVELTNLIKNKDAVQEPTTDESVLRAEQPEVELQGVGEGNAQPEEFTTEKEIADAKQNLEFLGKGIEDSSDIAWSMSGDRGNLSQAGLFVNGNDRDFRFNSEEISELNDAYNKFPEVIEGDTDINFVERRNLENKTKEKVIKRYFDEVSKSLEKPVEKTEETITNAKPEEVKEPSVEQQLKDINEGNVVTFEYKNESEVPEIFKDKISSKGENNGEPFVKVTMAKSLANFHLQEKPNEVTPAKEVTPEVQPTATEEPTEVTPAQEVITEEVVTPKVTTQGLSEAELPGYDRMITESEAIIKEKRRGRKIAEMHDAVMEYVIGSKVYEDATDVQREALVRDVRKRFGIKEKSAPSVNRLFGKLKDIAKITMTEKAALVKQIKDLARGGKDAQKAIREATQALTKEITSLREGGKINKPQEKAILNRLGKTNVLSETSVRRYVDYVSKVYADAEYSGQLSKAKSVKSDINSLSKNKEKNASLKELGKEFAKIEPSMVEDIYTYNDIASKIKVALEGSKIRGQKVNFADTVNIDEAIDFTNKAIESQTEKLREERIAELQDLLGVDASKFSVEEIDALLKGEKEFKDNDEKIVRATINKAFDIYSSIVKEVIKTGKDTFTDEPIEFTKTQKELVKKFMDMDLSLLEKKDALAAVDSLVNFLVNKSTAKMDAVVNEYQGVKNIKELTNKGIKSRELTKFKSKILGRQLADKVTSLPVMFEKMFPGLSRSGEVMDKIGLTNLFNKRSAGLSEGNNIVDDFVKKLYKKKANGEDYNTEYNITERALAAHAIRSLIGTEEQIKKEFEDRKSLIDQSIDRLSNGSDKEKKLSELYKKAYDKILKDSDNKDEVLSKVDSNNKEGVDFWIEEFNKKYDQSADVSENIYNTKLDRDLNYTPMKVSKLSTNSKEVELDNDQSSFHSNNGSIIVPKTGSLNEIQRLSVLPEGTYIDLSFDKNMANSMYDLLTDINTAGPIRQIKAAINSPEFDKLVPYAEDRALLKGGKNKMGRIELYVKLIRNKSPYSTSEDMKALNRISAIGVGQALAGVGQPFKQVIPVAVSTFINTKGKLKLGATFNPKTLSFIDNSGYSIANRGRQSQAEIEAVNRLIEKSEGSLGSKAIKYIEKANELQLKYLLEKPDAYIAKASWITYYEEALRKQGENTKDIDYSQHELNENAANYAQRQVDRQQNISDKELAGRLYTDKNNYAQLITKMLMPFSSFRMNASAKFGADMITLSDKTSSKEDKAIAKRSIAGYAAEMAVFRAISIGSALLIGSLANKYLGKDESDEDFEKRRDNLIKGAATGTFTDLFSPIPVLDPFVQQVGAKATEGIDELMGTNIAIYDVQKQDFLKEYGTLGISIDRLGKLWTLGNLAFTGKYKDDYGKEKEISEEDRMALVPLVPLSLATDLGLAPTEINSAINYAVKFSKKGGGGIDREKLKKTNPRLYEKMYGENSLKNRASGLKEKMESKREEMEAKLEKLKNKD